MVGGSRLFDAAKQFFQTPIEDLRPLNAARLDRLAKPAAHDEELMRAGYQEIQKILKETRGRPLTADELRRAVQHTNPTKANGFRRNCSECAMAVDDILRGRPAVAGDVADPPNLDGVLDMFRSRITGEADDIIAGKSGAFDDIEAFLLAKRPGTRGILWGQTSQAGGGAVHVGNVANIDREVYYVDGQVGLVDKFIPTANKYFEVGMFLRTR